MKPENLRHWTIHIRHLSDIPVLRNWYKTYMFNTTTWIMYTKSDIYMFFYNFDTVLCQFLETGTSDRRLIGIV